MKIKNLKESLDAETVKRFKFGDADANQDKILNSAFCSITGINEILLGNKSYVIGVKGTGKTAIFKSLKEEKIKVITEEFDQYKAYYFNDTIQFDTMKRFVDRNIKADDTISKCSKFQLIWELFIVYNILYDLKMNPIDSILPKNISDYYSIFETAFQVNEKYKLIDFIMSMKAGLNIKYDQMTHVVIPGISIEANPKLSSNKNEAAKNFLELNLNNIKKEVINYLFINKKSVVILFDRLDDFVTKSDYTVQQDIISALVRVERSYIEYENIKFIVFLRNDLFEKIDYTDIGYDKVATVKTELIWKPQNIREFIGRRIAFNYFKYLKITHYSTDSEKNENAKKDSLKTIFSKLFSNKKMVRDKNLVDSFNKALIGSLFKHDIMHYNKTGICEPISFLDFLESHFCLANGYTNPRTILIFLEMLMEKVRSNIDDNFIETFKYENGSYNIVTDEMVCAAYRSFQNEMNKIFIKIDNKHEKMFETFILRKNGKVKIKAEEIFELLGKKKRDEIKEFIIFLEHILYLKNISTKTTPVEKRSYEIPLMFRMVHRKDSQELA